ncbi:hypothetical protein Anas_04509, partial [Armadillidium nasatum]
MSSFMFKYSSMLPVLLTPSHFQSPVKNTISYSSALFSTAVVYSKMHANNIPHTIFTVISVAPSIGISISNDESAKRYLVLKQTPSHTPSHKINIFNGKMLNTYVTYTENLPYYLILKRSKRSINEIAVTSSLLNSFISKTLPVSDYKTHKEKKIESEFLHNANKSDKTYKNVFETSDDFMKNLVSQTILNLPSVSKIIKEILNISKDEENALLPLKHINLYANDIVRSETEDKHSFSPFLKETVNKNENKNEINLEHSSFPTEKLGETNISNSFNTSLFNSNSLKTQSDFKFNLNYNASNILPSSYIHSNYTPNTRSIDGNIHFDLKSTILYWKIVNIKPSPVLKTKNDNGQINKHPLELNVDDVSFASSFDVTKTMSELNHAFEEENLQKETSRYQELSSVNFPEERKRQHQKESYNTEGIEGKEEVSNRIRVGDPLELKEEFKEDQSQEQAHELFPSVIQENKNTIEADIITYVSEESRGSSPKSSLIPEKGLESTREMFNKYSNSAPRINVRPDIESVAFFNVSSIYLSSAFPPTDSEHISHIDEKTGKTVNVFESNMYTATSISKDDRNLLREDESRQDFDSILHASIKSQDEMMKEGFKIFKPLRAEIKHNYPKKTLSHYFSRTPRQDVNTLYNDSEYQSSQLSDHHFNVRNISVYNTLFPYSDNDSEYAFNELNMQNENEYYETQNSVTKEIKNNSHSMDIFNTFYESRSSFIIYTSLEDSVSVLDNETSVEDKIISTPPLLTKLIEISDTIIKTPVNITFITEITSTKMLPLSEISFNTTLLLLPSLTTNTFLFEIPNASLPTTATNFSSSMKTEAETSPKSINHLKITLDDVKSAKSLPINQTLNVSIFSATHSNDVLSSHILSKELGNDSELLLSPKPLMEENRSLNTLFYEKDNHSEKSIRYSNTMEDVNNWKIFTKGIDKTAIEKENFGNKMKNDENLLIKNRKPWKKELKIENNLKGGNGKKLHVIEHNTFDQRNKNQKQKEEKDQEKRLDIKNGKELIKDYEIKKEETKQQNKEREFEKGKRIAASVKKGVTIKEQQKEDQEENAKENVEEFENNSNKNDYENDLYNEEEQHKEQKQKKEIEVDEEDHDITPFLQKAFDQHSDGERKSLSWDHNKEPMQVTYGMETASSAREGDHLQESYVPIFQLEKHHLRHTNIYSDQDKHQNETLQPNIEKMNSRMKTFLNTSSDTENLVKNREGTTKLKSSSESLGGKKNETNRDPEIRNGENLEIKNESVLLNIDLQERNNVSSHKHRHHHGEPRNMIKNSVKSSLISSSEVIHTNEISPSLEMANQTLFNPSSVPEFNKIKSNEDIDRESSLKKQKANRKRERENCSLGKKGCSIERIAEAYLSLFGPKKLFSSHFYVVPILLGSEINLTSWHWKKALNGLNEHSSHDLGIPVNATGSTSVRRPHQIAPPDGASFSVLILGESLNFLIPPYGYWNLHLTLSDTTELHLALTIPRGTSLGLYARRNALPTHTQHDLMKVLRGSTPRESRSAGGAVEVALEEVLESGDWFLSLYNDDGDPHKVGLLATPGSGSGECPQRCNGRGLCFLGRCQCQTGYSGHDCSEG